MPFTPPCIIFGVQLSFAASRAVWSADDVSLGRAIPDPDNGKVLVVEDDYFAAWQAETSLQEAGFEVVGVVGTAHEAVALAVSEHPDLVVMDIRLRGKGDGIDAARRIRDETGIRCIFATAHLDPETRGRGEAANPVAWLGKPYPGSALVALVRDALKKQGHKPL